MEGEWGWPHFKHSNGASSRLHILLKQQPKTQLFFFFATVSINAWFCLFFYRKHTRWRLIFWWQTARDSWQNILLVLLWKWRFSTVTWQLQTGSNSLRVHAGIMITGYQSAWGQRSLSGVSLCFVPHFRSSAVLYLTRGGQQLPLSLRRVWAESWGWEGRGSPGWSFVMERLCCFRGRGREGASASPPTDPEAM